MTMKTKKIVLWYAVFVLALILNQSGAIQNDVKVIITSYGLWTLLMAITWIYFKNGRWE